MELHNLRPAEGSVKKRKRIGRGQGSTRGGTSTRGHKGAKSRSGFKNKKGFEGGQMPLQRRIPKRGFKNRNRVEYIGMNLDLVQQLVDKYGMTEFSFDILRSHNLVKKNDRVKILGRGTLTSNLTFNVHAYSATAKTAIEAAGGSANVA